MGTKLNPGSFDCYAAAAPDEPMFVLLARDITAPDRVEKWAHDREISINDGMHPLSDRSKVDEARECARAMREWRRRNRP
jgi:hypothetical protein